MTTDNNADSRHASAVSHCVAPLAQSSCHRPLIHAAAAIPLRSLNPRPSRGSLEAAAAARRQPLPAASPLPCPLLL